MVSLGTLRINPKSGQPEYWVAPKDYRHLDSDWTDIPGYSFTTGYPTENSEKLLERVMQVGSKPGDLVMDFFVGSGTTPALAQKLGRRWIACDINKGAIQTTSKRLQKIISEQSGEIKKLKSKSSQKKLIDVAESENEKIIMPQQFAFTTWRVNDYDLAIQHNEAINLACEYIGIERFHTDTYFDGVLGKSLVKIIPFGHPLSPLDLEELKHELDARPEEDRPITMVCLGIELSAKTWITDWNHLRKGNNAVNRIDVIELRTDSKYGKFMKHEPASARVKIIREIDKIIINIEDFISPTIIERLEQQNKLVKFKIDDWRAMVDCVMIDSSYDGKVFDIALFDMPEEKTDLVVGKYELQAPLDETIIAVKITDMLGEEVLVSQNV